MDLTVKLVENQKIWDKFVERFRPANFLSSWHWVEFNNEMGDQALPLGLYEGGGLKGVCLAVVTISRKGNFLLCPAGPLLSDFNRRDYWQVIIDHLKVLSRQHRLKFIRLRPLMSDSDNNNRLLASLGLRKAPVRVPAEVTWILDLSKPEDELLAQMRRTTRYLINKAQREGVKIVTSTNPHDLETYYRLEAVTVARHRFIPFSRKYITTQFEVFCKTNDALLIFAKFASEIIAAAVITFFGDSAFYNHGASLNTKVPGSYLIQWEAIKEAKRRGKKFYNFWGGIDPYGNPNHPWAGITLFKTGFGGEMFSTIHAHDLPISLWYWPIAAFEAVRYRLRGHTL